MVQIKLEEIKPIEYRPSMKYPQIVWYRDLIIDKDLTQKELNAIKKKVHLKKEVTIQNNPSVYLTWQYEDRPQLYLLKEDGKIYVSEGTLKEFGIGQCQQEASILLRILRKYKHASFKQVVLSTYRLGDTPDQRERLLEAFNRLNAPKEKSVSGWIENGKEKS